MKKELARDIALNIVMVNFKKLSCNEFRYIPSQGCEQFSRGPNETVDSVMLGISSPLHKLLFAILQFILVCTARWNILNCSLMVSLWLDLS